MSFIIIRNTIPYCIFYSLACVLDSLAGDSLLGEVNRVGTVDNHRSSGIVIARGSIRFGRSLWIINVVFSTIDLSYLSEVLAKAHGISLININR